MMDVLFFTGLILFTVGVCVTIYVRRIRGLPVLAGLAGCGLLMFVAVTSAEVETAEVGIAEAETINTHQSASMSLWDANPSTWQECMDRAFELTNNNLLYYHNGTVSLGEKRDHYTENTLPVANTLWYIAVCDRTFPEATGP